MKKVTLPYSDIAIQTGKMFFHIFLVHFMNNSVVRVISAGKSEYTEIMHSANFENGMDTGWIYLIVTLDQ